MKTVMLVLLLFSFLIISIIPTNSFSFGPDRTYVSKTDIFATRGNQTTPKYGGTLRGAITLPHFSSALNPLIWETRPSTLANRLLWANIFSCLLRLDEEGSLTSDLASTWQVSWDGLNYTFLLFENITWHDGVEFNASDVEYTYNMILTNPDVASYWKDVVLSAAEILEVRAIEPYAVEFLLNRSSGTFLDSVAWIPIIPKHIYEGTDFLTNPANYEPMGTGPFRFVEWFPDSNITLEAYEQYFRGRPFLDGFFLRWDLSAVDTAGSLLDNTIDIIPGQTDPYRIQELVEIPGVSVIEKSQLSIMLMDLNLSNQYLEKLEVRQALLHALNKSEILRISHFGYAEPAWSPISPEMGYWYNPNITKLDYNVTRAEKMLDEAGYLRDPETGVRFDLNLRVVSYDPHRVNACQLIKEDWQMVGVNTTLEIWSTTSGFWSNFDIIVFGFGGWTDPFWLEFPWSTNGPWNFGGYSNPHLDDLLMQGGAESNQTTRKQIYDEVQEILAVELPSIWLYHPKDITAFNNDFHGFVVGIIHTSVLHPYSIEKVWYDPTLSGQGKSPIKVCFEDEQARRTGFFNDSAVEQIPNSTHDEEFNVVKIRSPSGNYTVEVVGTGNGTYSLEVVNIALDYKHTAIPSNTIHINQTRTYLVQVFPDGTMKVWDPLLDIYLDWKIDIRDIAAVAIAYGSVPGDPKWNKAADIYEDDKIDIRDIAMVAKQFGKVW